MSAKINPLPGYVAAEIVKQDEKTESGLFITESARETFDYARVVEVGEGVSNVKKGDLIIYRDFGDEKKDVKIGKKAYVVLNSTYILGTVTN